MILSYLKVTAVALYIILVSIFALVFAFIDRSFTLYLKLNKILSAGVLKITGVKFQITGLENIDKNKTYVYVSNHSSQFDIAALQYSIPQKFSMFYKKELSNIPIFGWALWAGPYISIDRMNAEKARRSLEGAKLLMDKKNISVLLFAEGTRSKTGEILPFKRGAFHLAATSGHPIIPVTISKSQLIMPKGKFRINKGTIDLHFDKPIDTNEIKNRKDQIELMEIVRNIIISNHQN
ncbi:MAG: hypothetical protein CO128_08525 [Ignavibacteriales bacterium CG_4_9_14_3_um_filter_30_11]|nr:MAG: hypothetical protein CO128_08525 [Ignavibacteriales bacterium CG_4_9_14_3_um_filter_30_11]